MEKSNQNNEEITIENPTETTIQSDCIECRIRVEYVGWDWFTYKRVYRYYYSTSLTSVPLVIDKGFIQSKKVGSIALQAKVITEDEPCNCSATVDGKINHVKEGIIWDTWSVNWLTFIKSLAALAIPSFLDLKKLSLGLTGPYGISVLLHTIALSSIEAKIKEVGHEQRERNIDINCEWKTLVTVFDLGRVAVTRAILAEVEEKGKLISKIMLYFRS